LLNKENKGMKLNKIILILILILACFENNNAQKTTPNEEAQKPVGLQKSYGLFGAYGSNAYNAQFKDFPGYQSCCNGFENGGGSGFAVGAIHERQLTPKWWLDFRFGLQDLSGTFQANDRNIGNVILPTSNGDQTITGASVRHNINTAINSVMFSGGVKYSLFDNFYLNGGLQLNLFVTGFFEQEERLLSPDNVVFEDTGERTRGVVESTDIPDLATAMPFIYLGASYDILLSKSLYFAPEFRYQFGFTDAAAVDWTINVLYLGMSLKKHFVPKEAMPIIEDTLYIRDTVIVEQRGINQSVVNLLDTRYKKKSQIKDNVQYITHTYEMDYRKSVPTVMEPWSVSVSAYSKDEEGNRKDNPEIIIEEIETEEGFPLLPFVYFKRGSDMYLDNSLDFLNQNQIAEFDENKLPRDVLGIYREVLNVIGSRLKANPKAKLTLTGCNNDEGEEKNNLTLSRARAARVANYFKSTWGIDDSRLEIRSRNLPQNPGNTAYEDGKEENQRVEISSNISGILKPISIKEIQKTSNPPVVYIEPKVSGGDAQTWELLVKQESEQLREYKGNFEPKTTEWKITGNPEPTLEKPVNIQFSAMDDEGRTATATANLEIKQLTIRKKRYELREDKRVEKFSLILFDYDKAELNANQQEVIKEIAAKIKPNSKVTIAGYTDRTGDATYNKNLALRRIMQTAKALKVREDSVKYLTIGNDELLYDNNTPQGRSYCRTVLITIETPVTE